MGGDCMRSSRRGGQTPASPGDLSGQHLDAHSSCALLLATPGGGPAEIPRGSGTRASPFPGPEPHPSREGCPETSQLPAHPVALCSKDLVKPLQGPGPSPARRWRPSEARTSTLSAAALLGARVLPLFTASPTLGCEAF